MARIGVRIAGTGSAVPDKILSNEDLSRIVDTSDEWITERTGIKRRHIAEDSEKNSDFSALACQRALADAGADASEVDFLILGTVTGDMIFPSTACLVQDRIGAKNAAAWDISAACSGFLYAMAQARAMLSMGMGSKALVVGAEMLSRVTNWTDRSTCVLFGDGAGAVLLETCHEEQCGVLSTYLKSDGSLNGLLSIPDGGSARPISAEIIARNSNKIQMKGNEVFKHAVRNMLSAARAALDEAGLEAADLDLVIPHQANIRIIEAISSRLELPSEKVFINIQDYGNTSTASIPIALDQARREGRIGSGSRVLLVAFGGGFTWSATVIKL